MSEDRERVLQEALARGEEGEWEEMARLLREALEEDPEDPYILCWLGVAERELGLEGVAYDHFRAALALQPEDPHLLVTAGAALARFDDPDAETALRAAAVMAPKLPLARWMYGGYLAREGYLEEGIQELRAALELDPENATVHLELGVALVLGGRLQEGLEALETATELEPADGWARVLLGLVQAEAGRMEEAAGSLVEGARATEEDVEAQLLAALAAAVEGWEETAWEMLERARQRAVPGDLPLLETVEERLGEGPGEAESLLLGEILPGALRERLMTRP